MIIQFKDRKEEMNALKEIINSDRFEMTIIYGRRRVGKTALVLEATKDVRRIYFLATEKNNLKRFYNTLTKRFPEVSKLKEDYEILFEFLKDKVDVVIIDEFQNMIKEDESIISLLQAIVDTVLVKSRIKLFLLGSSISIITSKLLSYKSPLYGRKTASIELNPIPFIDLKEFFPDKKFEDLLYIYSFTGGIPYYIIKIEGDFWKWLDREIKKKTSFIRDEIDFVMRYEFEDVSTYKLILQAIAFGKNTVKEIKDFIGLKRTDISPYLKNLMLTGFIERKIPITEKPTSRKGRYFLADNFLRFWFRFIYPNLSSIEEGIFDIHQIKKEYPSYIGRIFEEVSLQLIKKIKVNTSQFTKIGKWWHKDKEIDILALNEQTKEILFAECKWQNRVNAEKVVKELVDKTQYVNWHNNERKEYYAIFAKSFSKRIKEFDGKKVYCFDLKDLEKVLKREKRK